MIADIVISETANFEVASDGNFVKLTFNSASGCSMAVSLPLGCLAKLLEIMPSMFAVADRRQQISSTAAAPYPLAQFKIEHASEVWMRILTLSTADGFTVSFSLSEDQCRSIGFTEPPDSCPPWPA